jgi:hypothetical protein
LGLGFSHSSWYNGVMGISNSEQPIKSGVRAGV